LVVLPQVPKLQRPPRQTMPPAQSPSTLQGDA
jgi:hypothetical protein